MEYIVAICIGYLLGNINAAYLIGKSKGFDIRTKGTFNAGASNAKMTMGWKYGVIVAVCDALKATFSVIIVRCLFPDNYFASVIAGCMAVVGHCFPFYMGFRGGKGFASYVGLILALDWKFCLIVLVVGVLLTIVTDWIVTATLTTIISFPIYMAIFNKQIWYIWIPLAIVSLIILVKHFPNFKKIKLHQEVGLSGKPVFYKPDQQ